MSLKHSEVKYGAGRVSGLMNAAKGH